MEVIKYSQGVIMFYDTHTHTRHSCDCSKVPEDAIITAIKNGLSGIAITDHSDLRLFEPFNIPEEIPASCKEADGFAEKYKGQIEVFSGIEISDAAIPMYKERLKAAFNFYDYDIVLASVHIVDPDGKPCELSSHTNRNYNRIYITAIGIKEFSRFRIKHKKISFAVIHVIAFALIKKMNCRKICTSAHI